MRVLPLVVLLAACSEYNLQGSQGHEDKRPLDSGGDPATDTGIEDDYEEDVDPDVCESRTIDGDDIALTDECYVEGTTVGSFTPVLEWAKDSFSQYGGSTQVMMMPAVGSLTDDDGDGDADEDDTPDIVFITYGSGSVIRVVSGDGGAEILNISDNQVQGQGGVALGDIDGDGWQDIVVATNTGVRAYDHTGAVMWTSGNLSSAIYGTCDNPAISDMNGDGSPEIVMGAAILNAKGKTLGKGTAGIGGVEGNNVGTTSFAVDIDGDGEQEVVVGNALYDMDGNTIWSNGKKDGYVAVGNFDSDDKGEIVVSGQGKIRLQDDDGTVLCQTEIPGADGNYYGGPPTVADFDGDGEAEFAAAAGSRYSVFESDCSVKWQAVTQDASSGNTGSAVFDFEGDGEAEAVYADETRLWAFAGPDGTVKLESSQHSNATWLEYPTIADVDGDGQAEIVVANTAYTASHAGIYVFGDADSSWRQGRKIWNQHAYHITNVDDDGGIPKKADQNWLTYNNFRSGDVTASTEGYEGPDLRAGILDVCLDECADGKLVVWVYASNAGYTDVEEDVEVVLWGEMEDGSTRELASTTITDSLPSGRRLDSIELTVEAGARKVVSLNVTIDGGNSAANGVVDECIEDNNEGDYTDALCE